MNRTTLYFLETLVRLLEARCSLREALEILSSGEASAAFKAHARKAKTIRDRLSNGESLSDALDETGILQGDAARAWRIQLDRSGDVARTLSVVLRERKRERDLAATVTQALLYPAFLVTLTICFSLFLGIAGIPWIRASAFIRDPAAIVGMYAGVRAALASLFFLVGIPAVLACVALRKLTERVRYWSLACSLAASGIALEVCLGEGADFLSRACKNDAYTKMTLESAEYTGDYESALDSIAMHHERKLESFRGTVTRLAEPVLIFAAGIAIAIVSVTVFLPLFNLSGGFA